MGDKPLKEYEGKINVCARAIIENQGRVLLVKRTREPDIGFWCIPGGIVNMGETSLDAVIREVKEEVGLDINPRFLFYQDSINVVPNHHWLCLYFHAANQEDPVINSESDAYCFFSRKELGEIDIAFDNREVLERYYRLNSKDQ
ncbi:NUDIX hydrolase [Candidatus Woesearchaeota archaeon]|nr:NUDIX hydrolase [Candidatus Woesearchaeota archaeon]